MAKRKTDDENKQNTTTQETNSSAPTQESASGGGSTNDGGSTTSSPNSFGRPGSELAPSTVYTQLAGRVSSAKISGAPINDYITGSQAEQQVAYSAPGIMVFDYMSTLGYAKLATDPVNKSAMMQFNYIRSQISGSRPYQSADLQIYNMANADLRALWDTLVRMYGLFKLFNGLNNYVPRRIFSALHWSWDDFVEHSAEIYFWLQANAGSLSFWPIADIGTIYNDHAMLNSMIYADGDISRSQLYAFHQETYWSYEKVDTVKGLTPVALAASSSGTILWSDFKNVWNTLYTAFATSDDATIIAADIRRAYPDHLITDMFMPPVDYRTPIGKSDAVLDIIMNMQIHSEINVYDSDILQQFRIADSSDGLLVCTPSLVLSTASATFSSKSVGETIGHINTVYDEPDAACIARCMRLKPYVEVDVTNAQVTYTYRYFGTEIVTRATIHNLMSTSIPLTQRDPKSLPAYQRNANGITFGTVNSLGQPTGTGAGTLNFTDVMPTLDFLQQRSAFDWAPPVYMRPVTRILGTSSPGEYFMWPATGLPVYEDVQNVVPMSRTNFEQSFEAHLLSVLEIPSA